MIDVPELRLTIMNFLTPEPETSVETAGIWGSNTTEAER
jgi:hypothetical protein